MFSLFFAVFLLSVSLQGFPYRSEESKAELFRVGKVMALWSMTRVIWGVATLLVFVYHVELFQDSDTPIWSFIVLLLMFFVCEIVPIVSLLDYSYISMATLDCAPTVRNDEPGEETSISINSGLSERVASVGSSPARSVRWQDDELTEPLLETQNEDEVDA